MKYIKQFKTHAEYEKWLSSDEARFPAVSICDDDTTHVHYDLQGTDPGDESIVTGNGILVYYDMENDYNYSLRIINMYFSSESLREYINSIKLNDESIDLNYLYNDNGCVYPDYGENKAEFQFDQTYDHDTHCDVFSACICNRPISETYGLDTNNSITKIYISKDIEYMPIAWLGNAVYYHDDEGYDIPEIYFTGTTNELYNIEWDSESSHDFTIHCTDGDVLVSGGER